MSLRIDTARMIDGVARFGQARIMIFGDVMLDRFVWGRVRRISPEAPVPVVEVERETHMLGGAANVAHNVVALGGRASICGVVGEDEAGRQVKGLLDDLEVGRESLQTTPGRPTTVKTRVVAHGQQVVRVDHEERSPVSGDLPGLLWPNIAARHQGGIDAVIISDYAKGMITPALMEPLMAAARGNGLLVAVDPKVPNIGLFQGATVITPNHLEAAAAARIEPEGPDFHLAAGRILMQELGPRMLLVTQGKQGMTLFEQDEHNHIPTTAKRVFDVTGAGDTVISTLTIGLAVGLNPLEAAVLANLAAGEVVGEVGTSVVTGRRLIQLVEQYGRAGADKG